MFKGQPPGRPAQLAFDLAGEPSFDAEDFLVGPSNEAAYALIESWPDWSDPALVLAGPEGSGKSHLAAIWAARSHAWRVGIHDVTADRVPELASGGALVIEDCGRAPFDEAALFHLLNLIRARAGSVILTARTAPDMWGIATPDLLSRLRLAPLARIEPPDDALLKAVLVKLFLDRQLIIDTAVLDAVALRIPRSFAQARAVVDAIDRDSLERGKRVTRTLACEYADRLAAAAE
jgi:chromosomal replication initiation ATPase DnaA